MTHEQVKAVLDRVLTWPEERQQQAAETLLLLEGEGETYQPSDDEWAAIQEGMAEARRGEYVPAEKIEALLRRFTR